MAIITKTLLSHNLDLDVLQSGTRTRTVAVIRAGLLRQLRRDTDLSYSEIGGLLGYRTPPRVRK